MVCHEVHFLNLCEIDSNHWFGWIENSDETTNLYPLRLSLFKCEVLESLAWTIITFVEESCFQVASGIGDTDDGSHRFVFHFCYSSNQHDLLFSKIKDHKKNGYALTSLRDSPSTSQTSFGPGTASDTILIVTGVKTLNFFFAYWPSPSVPPSVR